MARSSGCVVADLKIGSRASSSDRVSRVKTDE